ncbi:MAG: conjugal transfer protein TraG N-terminal domain-containing protein [Gammaproteobacteria bacterium]|nr:conjugal transfer protein TraG N-terminal domain-containing protein [Gammaproteobacteria bacterium]
MANQKLTRTLIALAALLAPATAFATINPVGQNAWTLWAFGNGNVIYNLLYAASGLVSSSGYLALVSFLSLISVVAASVMAANNAMASKRLIAAILGIFAFISIGLKETANVAVDDPVTNYINVVPNVPALVAIPPAVISEAGYRMTQLLEQYYSLPNDLTLTGGDAFDLANSLVNAQTQVQVTSPGLRATVAAFTTNCILPALASGQLNAGQLVDSTALWSMDGQQGTLAQAEQSPFTPVYTGSSPGGTLVPCGPGGVGTGPWYPTVTSTEYPSVSADNAYQYISQYFTAAAPDWLANTASTFANTSTYSWLGSELTSAEQWDFGSNLTQSTGETIAQAAAVNLMNPSMRAAAVASGDSPLVTSLAVSQGQQSQISSWATAAALFRDLSGYIFSVLQAFILGIAPIILAVVVLPGAGKRILLSYGQVLIWLALWEPTMSVINFIVALYAQGTLGPTLGSSGGYSMMDQGVITQMTSNMELAAGFLASTVPLITWGLVKGGLAFTDFVVGAVGSSFATTAGAMAATGNVSLENFSMGNETLNQRMLASRTTSGQGQIAVDEPGEGVTTTFNQGGAAVKTPMGTETIGTTATNNQAIARAESMAQKAGVSARSSAGQAASIGADMAAQSVQDYMNTHSVSSGTSTGTSASTNLSGNSAYRSATGYLLDHNMSEKSAKEFGAQWAARMGNPERQAAAKTALGEANTQQAAGNLLGAQNLRNMAAGILGGLSISGGTDGSTSMSNSATANARHSTSGSHDYSSGSSADIKNAAAVNKAMQHTMQGMVKDSHSLGTSDKHTLQTGIDLAQHAAKDFGIQLTATHSLGVARNATIFHAGLLDPNAAADAVSGMEHRTSAGQQAVHGVVQSHLEAAAILVANAKAAAAGARTDVKAHPVPAAGNVSHTVAQGANSTAAGLHGRQEQIRGEAKHEIGLTHSTINADTGHAKTDGGTAASGFGLMAKHVHGAINGWGPAVADSQNPDGTTNAHIGALGATYATTAGVGGLVKNAAQGFFNKPSPGNKGESSEGGDGSDSGAPNDPVPSEPATNPEGVPTVPGEAESAVSDIESGAEAVVGDAAEVGLP